MLKVYFTAATSYDGDLKETHKNIIDIIEKNNVQLLSGKQIVSDTILQEEKKLPRVQIFKRERKLIEMADCIIAEVTKPSLGVGVEIAHALTTNKPVLALLYKENEDKISPMIAGNPSDYLYLNHYEKDNVHFLIEEFLNHVSQLKKRKGKLIVVDGADGSGKTTQAHLLVSYLKHLKIPVKYFDFPRYYSSFHGRTVGKFLRGEFGNINEVSPYLASLAYALDRAAVKQEMEEILQKGGYIIANRYATSNMAHQAAKFKNKKMKSDFLSWVYELEYKIHRIPIENLVIYLYVPWQIAERLIGKKGERKYLLGNTKDIHEQDNSHRIAAERMYLALAKKNKHWVRIDCVKDSKLLSPQLIHQKIVTTLKSKRVI